MIIKFFLFVKVTSEVIIYLPCKPENNPLIDRSVIFDGKTLISGINLNNVNYYYNENGFEIPDSIEFETDQMIYNKLENKLTINEVSYNLPESQKIIFPENLDPSDFLERFTDPEILSIYQQKKTDDLLEIFLDLVKLRKQINLKGVTTSKGLDYLINKGIITEERKVEILTL